MLRITGEVDAGNPPSRAAEDAERRTIMVRMTSQNLCYIDGAYSEALCSAQSSIVLDRVVVLNGFIE